MSFRNRNNQGSSSGRRRFNTNPPSSDKPSCSYCHKHGHHINDCFSRQKATNSSQSNSNSQSNKSHTSGFSRHPGSSYNPSNHTPHNSGSSDASMSKHKVKGMHSIQTNNSDQLLRVHGTVDNVTNLLCTLDSASSVATMSESTAHHYKVPIHPSDIQIKSANNAFTSVVGVTDSLFIDIQGHSCQVTFIVLHYDDHEILLGLDWFNLTGASFHPRDLLLKFPGTLFLIFIIHQLMMSFMILKLLYYLPLLLTKTISILILIGLLTTISPWNLLKN
jgi:hypothetical protein